MRDYESTNPDAATYAARELDGPDLRDEYQPDPPAWQPDPPARWCGVAANGRVIGGCGALLDQDRPCGAAPGLGALWHPGCLRAHAARRSGEAT